MEDGKNDRTLPENWPPQDGDVWEMEGTGTFTVKREGKALRIYREKFGIALFSDEGPSYPSLERFAIYNPVLKSRRGAASGETEPGKLPEHWPPVAGDTWQGDGRTWTVRESHTNPSCIMIEPSNGANAYSDLPGWGAGFTVEDFARLKPVLTSQQGRDVVPPMAAKDLTMKLDGTRERTAGEYGARLKIVEDALRKELDAGGNFTSPGRIAGDIISRLDIAERKAKGDFGPELTELRKEERALRDMLTQAINDLSRAEKELAVAEAHGMTEPLKLSLRSRTGSLVASGARIATLMGYFQASVKEITE